MASLEMFESTLKEVVQAKRLSASKMTKLTDIALKCMTEDTQLVSILYRTHKSLPPAAKVSSLYAFDALSRAARGHVNKLGMTGDINAEKGNCATFLLKVEGVLEGLFQDMIMIGTTESKEKTKKILDIWAKGNTFPPSVLTRLKDVVKDAGKEPDEVKTTTTDPRGPTTITPPVQELGQQPTPLSATDPVQSTLLALLSQAANAVAPNGQTGTNTGSFASQPPLDNTQLALLQQLTQTVKLGNGIPQPVPVPLVPPHLNHAFGDTVGRSQSPPHYHASVHKYDRYNSPEERGRGRDDYHDDRVPSRGGFRGGFRGRGRGDGRGRWDDHDYFRDRDRSPYRQRRSRSRSPPSRYGGRRDVKPYSPPGRPSAVPVTALGHPRSAESMPSSRDVEKDEFGRDIRPPSPKAADSVPAHDLRTQPQPVPPVLAATSVDPPAAFPNSQIALSPVAASTSSHTPDAPFSNAKLSQQGLDKFEIATFDPTTPASWESLGKMWQVTYGYAPSQEALLQFVANGMVDPTPSTQPGSDQVWSEPKWTAGSHADQGGGQMWRGGRGRGGFQRGGRGGFGQANTRDSKDKWSYEHESDAIVLGGDAGHYAGSGDAQMSTEDSTEIPRQGISAEATGGNVAGAGRMQRVGDKWVFVRDPAV